MEAVAAAPTRTATVESLDEAEPSQAYLFQLLMLNLVLQAFDGIATYIGLQVGFQEANPLLVASFGVMGIGSALLFFKIKAAALLVVVYRLAPPRIGATVLRFLAAVYCCLSLGPWLAKFLALAATIS
jgi:uncharacterized membrane protein